MSKDINSFTRDYIVCALWSSVDDIGEPLDDIFGVDDLPEETINKLEKDCDKFRALTEHIDFEDDHPGHDFWLTRNRHGAGFWDGDYPKHGDELTKIAQSFGECQLYVGDDSQVYCE